MKHLIDKAAVVAEIDIKIRFFTEVSGKSNSGYTALALGKLKSFLDTIEVKEIELEKEIKEYFKNQPKITKSKGVNYQLIPSGEEIAKHFFKLGLKKENNMKHLIDKDALVAEVDKRIQFFTKESGTSHSDIVIALFELLSFLDTLEVKEEEDEEIAQESNTFPEPIFKEGDIMRTKEEARAGITEGLPVIVSIDKFDYHCNNETIPIKEQEDYEFPPINRKQLVSRDDIRDYACSYSHQIWGKLMDNHKRIANYSIGANDVADLVLNAIIDSYDWSTKVANPRFKKKDWIVGEDKKPLRIIEVDKTNYKVEDTNGQLTYPTRDLIDQTYHAWTLKDAQDGDYLATTNDSRPFIFKGTIDPNHPNSPVAYVGIDTENELFISISDTWWTDEEVRPATIEEINKLNDKLRQDGQEWNKDLKRLINLDRLELFEKAEKEAYQKGIQHVIELLEKRVDSVKYYSDLSGNSMFFRNIQKLIKQLKNESNK